MKRRGLHIIIVLAAGLLAVSCGTSKRLAKQQEGTHAALTPEQQRRYDYFFLESVRLKLKEEYDAAFDMVRHCLAIDPGAASALYEVSQYYSALKQPDKAEAALEKAVAAEPDNYWYCQGLANLYQRQNEMDKAAALWEEMVSRFPDKLDPLYSLLDTYNRQEDYTQAIYTLNRLEEKTGKSEQLSMQKFRIYLQMDDDKGALNEIESLVAEYPKDLRYQVVLGDVYMQRGKTDEAYDIYRRVLDEEPDNELAMYSLSAYYQETGQDSLYRLQLDTLLLNKKVDATTKVEVMRRLIVQDEQGARDSTRVISLFDRILDEEPDDAALPMLYAQYLISKGMKEESAPVLQKVLDIEPDNATARVTLLSDAIGREDTTAVIRLCETGIETNPDMPEFYFYLAVAYNQEERDEEVITVCRKALDRTAANSKKELVSDFYTIMADACHSLGRNEEAYLAYDSALVYYPSNISALNNYAYYLSLEHRDLDRAEEMSYKTVKAEPANATYLDTYAWILFEKGNYAEARLYIDEAMKNDGADSVDIVEHCGDIYYMSGDEEGAMEYWKKAQEMGSDSKTLKEKIQKKRYIAP
ncbi:MAG: tetratricopeptide repeat protein [Prevotellaceae bacterium]|nr:tetratricopeptide repeat protein [Prevotellaceae bacterium]